MLKKLKELLTPPHDEKGQGVVEYALVLGVVAIIAVYLVGQGNLQQRASSALDNINTAASIINAKMIEASNSSSMPPVVDDDADSDGL